MNSYSSKSGSISLLVVVLAIVGTFFLVSIAVGFYKGYQYQQSLQASPLLVVPTATPYIPHTLKTNGDFQPNINPAQSPQSVNDEMIARKRNSQRLTNIGLVRHAIDTAIANAANGVIPFQPGASGNSCVDSTATNGTGWVPYNAGYLNIGSIMATLPKDPINSGKYCYYFKAGQDGMTYKLETVLEPTAIDTANMAHDGGIDPNAYETGTLMSIPIVLNH